MRWLTHTFVVEKHEPPPTWNQSTCHSSLPPSRTLQYNATNDGCSVYSPRQIVSDSDILGAGKIVCNDEHSKGSTEWSSPCGGSDSPHSTWRWNRIINSLSAQAQAAQVSIFCAVSVSMSTTHKLQWAFEFSNPIMQSQSVSLSSDLAVLSTSNLAHSLVFPRTNKVRNGSI